MYCTPDYSHAAITRLSFLQLARQLASAGVTAIAFSSDGRSVAAYAHSVPAAFLWSLSVPWSPKMLLGSGRGGGGQEALVLQPCCCWLLALTTTTTTTCRSSPGVEARGQQQQTLQHGQQMNQQDGVSPSGTSFTSLHLGGSGGGNGSGNSGRGGSGGGRSGGGRVLKAYSIRWAGESCIEILCNRSVVNRLVVP